MTAQPAKNTALMQLLQARSGLIVHQALYAVAKLGVADLLERGVDTSAKLASELTVNEDALYRLLRALASQGFFEETRPRTFRNSTISRHLQTDDPESIRPALVYSGSDFYYRSLGEILHTIGTGEPARAKLFGKSDWEYMQQHPELARIFDDAMTNLSSM